MKPVVVVLLLDMFYSIQAWNGLVCALGQARTCRLRVPVCCGIKVRSGPIESVRADVTREQVTRWLLLPNLCVQEYSVISCLGFRFSQW
jgi:hypothetical protein